MTIITCALCGQERPHTGRGLCQPCYDRIRDRHQLDNYPRHPFRTALATELQDDQATDIAIFCDNLGYPDNPAALARRLHRLAATIDRYATQQHKVAP